MHTIKCSFNLVTFLVDLASPQLVQECQESCFSAALPVFAYAALTHDSFLLSSLSS